jgi:putative phage-type endonuclease
VNAIRLVNTSKLSREDWLRYRRLGIGGSDAPAIAGLSRWGNPLSVYLDKVSDTTPSEEETEAQFWGKELEPKIAEAFQKRSGLKVRNCNFILQHPKYKWMLANIDREVIGLPHKAGLECKNASQYKAKEWADELTPEEYLVQCSHYMMVTGWPVWFLAVLVGGNKFEWRRLERDMELEKYLFKAEADFWQLVLAKTPPALTDDGRIVGLEYTVDPPSIILPEDLAPKVQRFKDLNDSLKGPKKELEDLKKELNQIMEVIDPGTELFLCGERQLCRKIVPTKAFDLEAFREEQPELYEGYQIGKVQRRLTVK